METSAPKRRRTSPRTSVAVDPNRTDSPRDATPEREPGSTAHISSPTKSPRRRRPDFASPTKASLARHNPEILARRRSEREERRASELRRRSSAEPGASRQPQSSGSQDAEDDPGASRPGSRESDLSLSELLTAQRPAAGRSPIKPAPITRPLPPPAPDGEELVDPFSRRDRVRRSNQGRAEEEEMEPELPPTPSELGLRGGEAATSTPGGIHSESSPLKRRLAERERRRVQGSSPLKKKAAAAAVAAPVREESPLDRMVNPQADRGAAMVAHPARGVRADAEIAEKEDYLASLRQEEENLWVDLKLMADLGREWAASADAAKVLPLVRRHPDVLPQPEEEKDKGDDDLKALLQGAMDPSAWLPFAKPAEPTETKKEEEDLPPPISHHPIKMTAAEELPFLQILTPFTITSTGAPLSEADMASNTRRHTISLRAADYAPLFSAQLSLTVDLADFSVSDLKVRRLDPSAEAELGPFVDDLLIRTDRAVGRNVAVVCWAMGEWFRVAVRRAAFWRALHAEMGSEEVLAENVGVLWRRKGAVVARGEAEEEEEGFVGVKGGSAADLVPWMGRRAAVVPVGVAAEGVMVRIEWRISFDWAGDALSKVDIAVGVPGYCEFFCFSSCHVYA